MSRYNIAIIGVGLIGGSLGLALKKLKIKNEKLKIIGIGMHVEKLRLAKKLGAVDEYTTDFANGVRNADIVIVATLVDTIVQVVKKILPYLKAECIITDVGSVKKQVVECSEKVIETRRWSSHIQSPNHPITQSPIFIGAHPLAGSEKQGVKFASAEMFKNATVVITPTKNTSQMDKAATIRYLQALKTISNLWKSVGAKIVYLSPSQHDALVVVTSHLPHVLSAALVEIIYQRNRIDSRTKKLLAGSFRDFTRITDSDPGGWSAICLTNREEINKAILSYIKILNNFQLVLHSSNRSKENLHKFFSNAKKCRSKLLVG